VKYAEALAFPAFSRVLPEESKNWGWLRKLAHRMSHPFTVAENGVWDSVGYIILVFLMQMNFGWGVMFLSPALLGAPVLLSFANIGSTISLVLAFVCSAPLMVVAYYWFYAIFAKKNTRPQLPYILVSVDLFLVLTLSFGLYNGSTTKNFISSGADFIPFLVSYIFFLIPSITYFLIIIYESLVQFGQLISAISRSMRTIHDPLPLEQVKKLVIDEIPAQDGKSSWKLASISLQEIRTLRKWAEANLEATDKRALPAVFVIGFLALFLSSDTIRQFITEPIIQVWWKEMTFFWSVVNKTPPEIISWHYLLAALVFVLTLMFAKSILRTFSRLFRNLPVQSLVVEACILAESAHEEICQEERINTSPQKNSLIRFVLYLIKLFRGELG
jgi:hypothetical protein